MGLQGCDQTPQDEEEPVLHIYGWSDYIPESILQQFTDETGIEVTYDVFESNEILEAKLLMGGKDYDLVLPSASPFLARQIEANLYIPIDKSMLTNYDALDPKILGIVGKIDPNNQYSIPYVWGTDGIGYNKELVQKHLNKQLPNSWGLIFNPAYSNSLADCGISMSDSPFDAMAPAMVYLGYSPNSTSESDWLKAVDTYLEIRPNISNFLPNRAPEELLSGNLCVAQVWSPDVARIQERAKELCQLKNKEPKACDETNLEFMIPSEGAEIWCDCLAVPRNAAHPKNAHKFINFLLRPEIAAETSNILIFATANLKARKFIKPELLKNPIIYPSDKILSRLYVEDVTPLPIERLRTRSWLRIKGNS